MNKQYLHISVSAFMPYLNIQIKPIGFFVDDIIRIEEYNLKLCRPFPNKSYVAIQQAPSYRNRIENGLLFMIGKPKTDVINVQVVWEWQYLNFKDVATQNIELKIEETSFGLGNVLSTGFGIIPTMIFTQEDFCELEWKMKELNSTARFRIDYKELVICDNSIAHFVKEMKQQLVLQSFAESEIFDKKYMKSLKIPNVFQGHLKNKGVTNG